MPLLPPTHNVDAVVPGEERLLLAQKRPHEVSVLIGVSVGEVLLGHRRAQRLGGVAAARLAAEVGAVEVRPRDGRPLQVIF